MEGLRLDQVAGFLASEKASLEGHPDVTWRTDRITPEGMHERLSSHGPPVLIDVSTAKEFQETRIESSRNIPLSHLRERIDEVPADRTLVVCCRTGYRSAMALGILEQGGLTNVMHMVGGMAAWKASGLPSAR